MSTELFRILMDNFALWLALFRLLKLVQDQGFREMTNV